MPDATTSTTRQADAHGGLLVRAASKAASKACTRLVVCRAADAAM
jgi:hypothetical protein